MSEMPFEPGMGPPEGGGLSHRASRGKADLPLCNGCDTCWDAEGDELYLLRGDQWVCKRCFFSVGQNFPRPEIDTWWIVPSIGVPF